MPKIFISYRRQDSLEVTGRICDRLKNDFGRDSIFMDLHSIPPGVDFRKHIHDAVRRCDIVLVVIGPDWLNCVDAKGKRRLDDEGDFVRIEVEMALGHGLATVPVLVRDARMPRKQQLPYSLRDLVFRQAVVVRSTPDFDRDMERFVQAMECLSAVDERTAASSLRSQLAPHPFTSPEAATCQAVDAGRITVNSIGMKLALIPAGEFLMGSSEPAGDLLEAFVDTIADIGSLRDEYPQHLVSITRAFLLSVYPVTQAEYECIMGASPSHFQGDPNCPVEMVSWEDAQEFCRRLSALPAEKSTGDVYCLPTEAEWEYTCRAGTATRWCFGDDPAQLREYGWFCDNSGETTHPVGQKRPNAWGLYDMHGNVCEWCLDWYDEDYYRGSPWDDPLGPASGTWRVCRGGSISSFGRDYPEPRDAEFAAELFNVSGAAGSWYGGPMATRSASRHHSDRCGKDLGFRVARTLRGI